MDIVDTVQSAVISLFHCLTDNIHSLAVHYDLSAHKLIWGTFILLWLIVIVLKVFQLFLNVSGSSALSARPQGFHSSRRLTKTFAFLSLVAALLVIPHHACVLQGSWPWSAMWKPRALKLACENARYEKETAWMSLVMQMCGLLTLFSRRYEPRVGPGAVGGGRRSL